MSFDWKRVRAKHAALQIPMPEPERPADELPDGAGVPGNTTIVVQVVVKAKKGHISGAFESRSHGFMRLEVTRLVELGDDDPADWTLQALKTSVGKKRDDRVLRPERRHTLVIQEDGPAVMTNLRPWQAAYDELSKAVAWAREMARRTRNRQFGLLLACDVSDWTLVKSTSSKHNDFFEAEVVGISGLEVLQLERNIGIALLRENEQDLGDDSDVADLAED